MTTVLSMKCIKWLESHRKMVSKRMFQLECINSECHKHIRSLWLEVSRLQDELETRGGVEYNVYEDGMGSVYEESNRFISSNNYYAMDKEISIDSVERRAFLEKMVTDRRKKMLNEMLIDSDSECSGDW